MGHTAPEHPNHTHLLSSDEVLQIPNLLKMISSLRKQGLMAESIASSFMRRRVQPCQEQTNAGYEYLGINDPTSFKKELLMGVKLMDRLKRLFHSVKSLPPAVIGFSLQKPTYKVSVPLELFFASLAEFTLI